MIPVIWLAKDGVCSRCRMDEWFVEDLLDGAQKRPAGMPHFEHREVDFLYGVHQDRAIVVLPAGNHVDDVEWVNEQIRWVDDLTLILTSDEGQRFPVHELKHERMRLWVQTPRPEAKYPDDTIFFGVGSGRAWMGVEPHSAIHKMFLSAQKTHARRDACIANAQRVPGDVFVQANDRFMEGMPREDYLRWMNQTRWAPAPSGILTQDSFRFYEALERGALPIPDGRRPDAQGAGYWDLVAYGFPVPPIDNWRNLPSMIDRFPYPEQAQLQAHAWWHHRRRELARLLATTMADPGYRAPELTVIIPSSPIAAHPSLDMIDETVRSIRERTDAEILIMCDGIRAQHKSRIDTYTEYRHRLLQQCEDAWYNVTPILYPLHFHQVHMTALTLPMIDSEYLMFVEHDTPLCGDIDVDQVMAVMGEHRLNMMRFHHEAVIPEDHEWMMTGPVQPGGWRPTMQWSQRPHIARTDFYRERVVGPMAEDARVMIEDVMHGVLAASLKIIGESSWFDWRVGIWHPQGSIQRSYHLDGRGEDSKYEQEFRYRYRGGAEGRPSGAPHPQVGA